MKKSILYIFIIAITAASCGKELGDSNTSYAEDYRFFLKGQLDGLPFEFNAGQHQYFMETDYYLEDSVVVMEGRLSRHGSPEREAVVVRIRGYQDQLPGTIFEAPENLSEGSYAFRDATGYRAQTGKYLLNLYSDSTFWANSDEHYWVFEDGPTASGYETQKTIDVNNYPTYNVALRTTVSGGCNSEVRHYINLNHDCDGTFKMYFSNPNKVKAEVVARVGTISDVEWFLDEVEVERDFQGEIDLSLVPSATMLTCSIYFDDGCVRRIDRSLDSGLQSPCITDFWYTKEKPSLHDPKQYSTVEFEYFDTNGKKYTSHYTDVDGDFRITSSSSFIENDSQQHTMRFFMEANIILKNTDGSTVELKNGFGSFAVAHP